jgi:signal transduction histidine kinase
MGDRPAPDRLGLRAVLLAGFGVLLTLWLLAMGNLAVRVRDASQHMEEVSEGFLRMEDALQEIRTAVLLGAIDWRDAVLDTDPARLEVYRAQLVTRREDSTKRLEALRAATTSGPGRDALDALAREVDAYWDDVLPLIDTASRGTPATGPTDINRRLLPRRAQVIGIVEQVQRLNRTRLQQQQQLTADLTEAARQQVIATGVLAIVLSVAVGGLVLWYVTRLERRIGTELAANATMTADLHLLSARLVRAQEDERQHIARELHDEVGQALTAVKLELSSVRRGADPVQHERIDGARAIVDAALQSARNLSRLLRPPILDDMGLAAAIEWHLRGFSERTGVIASFERDDAAPRLPTAIETCLFRVVQEATTNVAKHAEASQCRVYLQRLPARAVLTVEDDGRGIEEGAAAPLRAGAGLIGMRERVAHFGGLLRVDSGRGAGTRITVEVPVSGEHPAGSAESATSAEGAE